MTGGYIPAKDAEGNMLSEEEIVERANDIVGLEFMIQIHVSNLCEKP